MNNPREQEALDAYFKLLHNKGADEDNLKRRKHCLQQFIPAIAKLASEGPLYREGVDHCLAAIPVSDWPLFLTVVREYFHFWMNDIKAIASMYGDAEFDPSIGDLKPLEGDLKVLWKTVEHEKFSTVELWPINTYSLALKQHGASPAMIETRTKLVKLLIIQMRNAPQLNNKYYRLAVDSLMRLFTVSQMRSFYLAVVREFFSFWIGDPEASEHIRIADPDEAS